MLWNCQHLFLFINYLSIKEFNMKKNSIKENLNAIKNIAQKAPKTINEAINFENGDMGLDEPTDMPQALVEPKMKKDPKIHPDELINDFRKRALRAMAELADTPEDPNYENLKRIWQLCDKAVNEKQDQRELAAKNPNLMNQQQ